MCADPVPLVGARDVEPWSHTTDLRRADAHGISGYECLAEGRHQSKCAQRHPSCAALRAMTVRSTWAVGLSHGRGLRRGVYVYAGGPSRPAQD